MKKVSQLIVRLFLIAFLAGYGPLATAGANGDGDHFSITICSNGKIKTVLVDGNGDPVELTNSCQNCLTCGHITGEPIDAEPSLVLFTVLNDLSARPDLILRNVYLRHLPRGPPAKFVNARFKAVVAFVDPRNIGNRIRNCGRSFSRDAIA